MGLVYVVEMNNDENRIEGIGLVRNYINLDYKTCLYTSDRNYNRYIYNSEYRKDRKDIGSLKMLEILEIILFKGSGHYKRGQGITTINLSKLSDTNKRVLGSFFDGLFKL